MVEMDKETKLVFRHELRIISSLENIAKKTSLSIDDSIKYINEIDWLDKSLKNRYNSQYKELTK